MSVAWACRGFADGLITSLREPAFSLFSRSSALEVASAFGDRHFMSAVSSLAAIEGRGKNTSVRCGGESFVGSDFISDF